MKPASIGKFLAWDTDFFGKRIGRITGNYLDATKLQEVMDWADETQLDCLYFLANVDGIESIRLVEDGGFRFQALRTCVARSLDNLESITLPDAPRLILRPAHTNDVEVLRPIAQHSYTWTRFYNDPCFSEKSCQQMYDIWLTKSIQGEYADYVVVAELDGKAIGYMTCKRDEDPDGSEGSFHLLGVEPAVRGQKIGQRVIVAAMWWLQTQGMTSVYLATQGRNIPVIRFYERLGFVSTSVQMWYHWWRTPSDAISQV